MGNYLYETARDKIQDGTVDVLNDTIQVMLLDDTHVDAEADEFVSDVVAEEITATSYVRVTLTSPTVGTVGPGIFDAADADFGTIGNGANDSIGHIIVFKDGASDASSDLLLHLDVVIPALPILTDGTNFTVTWNPAGIWEVQANSEAP